MSDKLPSLDDFTESDLPSVEEFLKEEDVPPGFTKTREDEYDKFVI